MTTASFSFSFRRSTAALGLVAAALATPAAPAAATDFGHHPAVTTAPADAGIDPSTFIPGHPARGAAGRGPHANFDHPALATWHAGPAAARRPEHLHRAGTGHDDLDRHRRADHARPAGALTRPATTTPSGAAP